jgi:predicted ATPase
MAHTSMDSSGELSAGERSSIPVFRDTSLMSSANPAPFDDWNEETNSAEILLEAEPPDEAVSKGSVRWVARRRQQLSSPSSDLLPIPGREHQVTALRRLLVNHERSPDSSRSSKQMESPCPVKMARLVMITGRQGVGKTRLVRSAVQQNVGRGYCVEGRFDPRLAHVPYSTLVSLLLNWIRQVHRRGPDARAEARSCLLKHLDPDEVEIFKKSTPLLSYILQAEPLDSVRAEKFQDSAPPRSIGTEECSDTESSPPPSINFSPPQDHELENSYAMVERFPFVFRILLRAIGAPDRPLVLLLQDLDRADPDSIALLERALVDNPNDGLIVVATATRNTSLLPPVDHDPNAKGYEKLSQLHSSKHVSVSCIHVEELDLSDTTYFISEIFEPYLPDMAQRRLRLYRGLALRRSHGTEELAPLIQRSASQGLLHSSLPPPVLWLRVGGLGADQEKAVPPRRVGTAANSGILDSVASFVWPRANGNMSQIWELLEWLEINHHLAVSEEGELSWNMSESLSIPATLSDRTWIIADKLRKAVFPAGFIDLLKGSACLGSQIDVSMLSHALPQRKIDSLVLWALEEGLLVVPNGSEISADIALTRFYEFVDDSLPDTIYELVPEGSREMVHVELGRRLWRRSTDDDVNQFSFRILSQFLLGRSKITREKERVAVATFCAHAGRMAAKMSCFRVALTYLTFGLELLDRDSWRDHYNLSLTLCNAAAEISMCTGQYEQMDSFLENVFRHGRSLADKLQAHTTKLSAFSIRDRQSEAVDGGIEVLESLGERFPRRFKSICLFVEFGRVQRLLRGKSDQQLLRLAPIANESKVMALQVLQIVFLPALLTQPRMALFFACRMLRITLEHGICSIGLCSFSLYGMALIAAFGMYEEASRYSRLGVSLLEQGDGVEYMARLFAAHYGCIAGFTEPMVGCLQPLLKAHRVGFHTGDIEFSSLCVDIYCFLACEFNVPLQQIERQWKSIHEIMLLTKQESLLKLCTPAVQMMHHLMGFTDDPLSPRGDLIDYDAFVRQAEDENRPELLSEVVHARMFLYYIFNEYQLAGSCSSRLKLEDARPSFERIAVSFRLGLVAAALVRENIDRRRNIRKTKRSVRILEKFATLGPHNSLDRLHLVRAELASSLGRNDEAFREFMSAIWATAGSQSTSVRALANECCARHLDRLGKTDLAAEYYRDSIAAYDEWGAVAKVKQLSAYAGGCGGSRR